MKKNEKNETGRINWRGLVKKPLFWLAVWVVIPFVFYIGSVIFTRVSLTNPFIETTIIMTPFSYFKISPWVISVLGIWESFYGVLLLRKKGNKFGVLHIILGIVIILFTILIVTLIKEFIIIS